MARVRKIRCHGCHRKIDAFILRSYYLPNKPIRPVDPSDPQYIIWGKMKISIHKRGWFKPRCNRSGKFFTQKLGITPSCQALN